VDDLELKKKEILSQQEKELDKIAEKHGNTPEADRKFADLSARNNAAIEELEKIAKNLEAKNLGKELPHPKINLKAIEGVKIR
jgi:exonuclease VII small subunit